MTTGERDELRGGELRIVLGDDFDRARMVDCMSCLPGRVRGRPRRLVFDLTGRRAPSTAVLGLILYAAGYCRVLDDDVHILYRHPGMAECLRLAGCAGRFQLIPQQGAATHGAESPATSATTEDRDEATQAPLEERATSCATTSR